MPNVTCSASLSDITIPGGGPTLLGYFFQLKQGDTVVGEATVPLNTPSPISAVLNVPPGDYTEVIGGYGADHAIVGTPITRSRTVLADPVTLSLPAAFA